MRERLDVEKMKIELIKEEINTKVVSKSNHFDATKNYTSGSQISITKLLTNIVKLEFGHTCPRQIPDFFQFKKF